VAHVIKQSIKTNKSDTKTQTSIICSDWILCLYSVQERVKNGLMSALGVRQAA